MGVNPTQSHSLQCSHNWTCREHGGRVHRNEGKDELQSVTGRGTGVDTVIVYITVLGTPCVPAELGH